ncbi:MAG: DUF6525 family protein [Pseudomonadota bacterium]
MPGNRGTTSLKRKRRAGDPMQEFDRLPSELRIWLSTAILPWRARSVQRAFEKALARTGDRALALRELDRLQDQLIAKDAMTIWGRAHPYAATCSPAPTPD